MEKISIRQSNKGFTLVEICVTLVLFSILATITTMSLIKWQEYSIFRTQEDNAELVYMAIKNKIAILNANNILDDQTGWGENEIYTGEGTIKKCYAYCNAGDYKNIKNGTLLNSSASLIFELAGDHLYDKNLLNEDILIVYTTDGFIEGVFFSDRCNIKNTFGNKNVNLSDVKKIKSEILSDNFIGAYIAR